MNREKSWLKFVISGSATDYIDYVNSFKETEISGRDRCTLLNRGTCNKGNESGGE